MIGRASVYIWAGENSVFAPGTAEKMIGQPTKTGQTIKYAKQVSPSSIQLEIEMEIDIDETDLVEDTSIQEGET